MPDTIIAASVKVDTAAANKSVADLKNEVKALQKEFENAKGGTAEQATAYKNLKNAQDQLASSTASLNKVSQESGGHFQKIREQIAATPGPLNQASEGVNKLGSSFKALLANPVVLTITLIVGALALLFKAFTNTFEGAEKVEQIFSGVKAAAQALLDNLGHIASAIAKFFTFDFSGAADEIKAVVNGVADAYSQMSKLTAQAQELHKEQLKNDLEQAQRAKDLAILREQAADESVPIAKRKAALQVLKKLAEDNAKEDVDLAKRTAENKIAQLTLEKDGARKNQDEINKIKIEQVQVETENANELRRINKQLTAAEKQEQNERKEAEKAALEERKKAQQQYYDVTQQLRKINQENELLGIKDQYAKDQVQLEQKIKNEKEGLQRQFQEKKITQEQLNTLQAALDEQANLQRQALTDKHNAEVQKADEDFQQKILAIRNKITLDGITDSREKEKAQLKIDYAIKLADAERQYKDDAVKFQQYKNAIDDELKAEQEKLDKKNKAEDDKKAFDEKEKNFKDLINDTDTSVKVKKAAVDAEQANLKDALDKGIISQQEYNDKLGNITEARKAIRQEELNDFYRVSDLTAQALDNLSTIFGKQTKIGKAFAIASATINTIESAVKSFNALADIPIVGPALGALAAGAALVSGYANVKKIAAVEIPGQGSSGVSIPGGGAIAPAAAPLAPPQQRGTKIDASSINDIGNAAAGGVNRNFKAYVVESENSAAVNRAARLHGASILGGN